MDIESKPSKLRHHSGGGSSVDEQAGRCGWTCASSEARGASAKWTKEASCSSSTTSSSSSNSSAGGKKSKGKLRKKGTKINETREDMDAQLLEQRSTNSSELDSPSLSGSLPSVADSHCSHVSEFSCSEAESAKASCGHDYHARLAAAAVSPLPEVEHDRLELCPASVSPRPPTSPASSSSSSSLGVGQERVGLVRPAEPDSHCNTREQLKEANHHHQTQQQQQQQKKSSCIQTDI